MLAGVPPGGRLIAQEEHDSGEAFALQFTPPSAQLMFTVDCYVPGEEAQDGIDLRMVELNLNGRRWRRLVLVRSEAHWRHHVHTRTDRLSASCPDKPSTLRVTLRADVPAASRFLSGRVRRCAHADYPFPAPPDPLPALDPDANLDPALATRPLALVSAGLLPDLSGTPRRRGRRHLVPDADA